MSCINCEALNSKYECVVCGTGYCSNKCRKTHWPKHRALCIAGNADQDLDWPEKIGYMDSYEVLESLGAGKYGQVYGLSRLSDGTKWAVKIMFAETDLKNDVTRLRLLSDGTSLDKECSIYVVCYYDHGKTYLPSGVPVWFIRTNYVEGTTLQTFEYNKVDRSKIMPQILQSALEALVYIHSFDVIHKDIKPENIMIVPFRTEAGMGYRVVLIDFGLACKNECQWSGGTPLWLPPEVLDGTNMNDKLSDVFSLGAILFYLVFGENEKQRISVINNMYKWPRDEDDWTPPWIFSDGKVVWADKVQYGLAMRQLELFTQPSRNRYAQVLLKMLSYDKATRPSAESALKKLKEAVA